MAVAGRAGWQGKGGVKISPERARANAEARRCPHCHRGGGLRNWCGGAAVGGLFQECRYCPFYRTWTPEEREIDHFPAAARPPAASDAEEG